MLPLHFADGVQHGGLCDSLLIPVRFNVLALATPVIWNISAPHAKPFQRLTELGVKKDRIVCLTIAIAPTATIPRTLHPSFYGVIVYYLHILSHRCTAYTPSEINLYARQVTRRERKPKYTAVRCGCHFSTDIVVGQEYIIVPR